MPNEKLQNPDLQQPNFIAAYAPIVESISEDPLEIEAQRAIIENILPDAKAIAGLITSRPDRAVLKADFMQRHAQEQRRSLDPGKAGIEKSISHSADLMIFLVVAKNTVNTRMGDESTAGFRAISRRITGRRAGDEKFKQEVYRVLPEIRARVEEEGSTFTQAYAEVVNSIVHASLKLYGVKLAEGLIASGLTDELKVYKAMEGILSRHDYSDVKSISSTGLGQLVDLSMAIVLGDKPIDKDFSNALTDRCSDIVAVTTSFIKHMDTFDIPTVDRILDGPQDPLTQLNEVTKLRAHEEETARRQKRETAAQEIARQQEVARERREAEAVARQQEEEKQAELFGELSRQIAEISEINDLFAGPWQLSKKAMKNAGLGELIGALVNGESGRTKEEAAQTVSYVERLNTLARQEATAENMAEYRRRFVLAEGLLASDLNSLTQQFNKLSRKQQDDLTILSPKLFSTHAAIELIRAEWPRLKDIITTNHPDGMQVIDRIDAVVFPSKIAQNESVSIAEATDEIVEMPLLDKVHRYTELREIAENLDQVILPPGATREDLERAVEQLGLGEAEQRTIDWDRLHDLVILRDSYQGTLYRSKPGSLGNAPPYYVLEIDFGGRRIAVAETPVKGNATYMVDEKAVGDSWLEALSMAKREARTLGAQRIIHKNGSHLGKIEDAIINALAV